MGYICFVLKTFDDSRDNVTSVAVSDHEILTASADCHVRRYDMRTGQMMADFIGCKVLYIGD